MLEFPLKMAADSGEKVLVEQMKRTLGVTPGLEDGRVCLGDFQSNPNPNPSPNPNPNPNPNPYP